MAEPDFPSGKVLRCTLRLSDSVEVQGGQEEEDKKSSTASATRQQPPPGSAKKALTTLLPQGLKDTGWGFLALPSVLWLHEPGVLMKQESHLHANREKPRSGLSGDLPKALRLASDVSE